MPRTRSKDYGERKSHILNVAAAMFADRGYMVCKMEDIAERCDVSKSMLYHYFKKKEDVLYEIVREHVSALNRTIEEFLLDADYSDNRTFFREFIAQYLQKSSGARERHAVTIRDTRWLTKEQMGQQEELERRNVELIVKVLKKVNPRYSLQEQKVYAYLLIGMINWIELWYSSSGPLPPAELYDRISAVFLNGFLEQYHTAKSTSPAATAQAPEPRAAQRKRTSAPARSREARQRG